MERIVGIDLGTTHCALAWVDPSRGPGAQVEELAVVQVVRPGERAEQPLLPSFVYLPAGDELPVGARALPWDPAPERVTGELARWQGARIPARVIASAKSWLSHPGVDRSAAILPWGAPEEVPRLSPVDASAALLTHLVQAWAHRHPEAPLSKQEVVLTVPASFDEAARALTVTAARRAGLERFTLLEEPQAALYDFTANHRDSLASALEGVRLVLVADVGGGTTDFTLVQVAVSPEGPLLRRIAVGDHLLLGGDNMDVALAHVAERKLAGEGKRLPADEWAPLVQAARSAKESLLGEAPPERHGIALAPSGSRLLGGGRSTELTRTEAEAVLLEGFFPAVTPADRPRAQRHAALRELGLPYVSDPAISRHLTAFLARHAEACWKALGERPEADGALPRPDALLLNGGVFGSPALQARVQGVLSGLWPDRPSVRLLQHASLDRAVARGAAYYGLVRRGLGLKIGGGAARAFYVALDADASASPKPSAAPASPTSPTSPSAAPASSAASASAAHPAASGHSTEAASDHALCLIPRGFEEGQSVSLGERRFQLRVGHPVQFRLLSTSSDRVDAPGDVVPLTDELKPLPPLHALLKGRREGEVPVHLEAGLTEIGTLELWAVAEGGEERWRLEFELRGAGESGALAVAESMPARFEEAVETLGRIYGNKPLPVGPKDVKQLFKNLERLLGPSTGWRLPMLRELWGALMAGASKRRRSADHERVFYRLLGFCLRPGFGYPLDGWRVERTFELFKPLVQHHGEKPAWIEFWILWRRVAPGLDEAAQAALFEYLEPHLARSVPPDAPKSAGKRKGIQPEGLDEMVRTAASLERLFPESKERLGGWIAARLASAPTAGGPWAWALGRLGARAPLQGAGHRVVPPELAERWLDALLELELTKVDGAPFAVTQLARRTGDRTRDLSDDALARAHAALVAAGAPARWVRLVDEVTPLEQADEARALGDTLPQGLRLSSG